MKPEAIKQPRKYQTEQEEFWAGEFGNNYISRNSSEEYLASNLHFFSKACRLVGKPASLIEFGANVGMNLRAIQLLFPGISLAGIEINPEAARQLSEVIGSEQVYRGSIFDYQPNRIYTVSLIKGVLIHIAPEMLDVVYDKLYHSSDRFILVCEYYNPAPVMISYRGHSNRLYKRDFAGELMERFPDLQLLDYGFQYRRDPAFPQDDITWFLLEKR